MKNICRYIENVRCNVLYTTSKNKNMLLARENFF